MVIFSEIRIGSGTMLLGKISKAQEVETIPLPIEGAISIIDVFDNYSVNPDLATSWGFGCVIKTPTLNILFDTGGNSNILLSNLEKMFINPRDIEVVVISHIHGDHLGGLEGFLGINKNVKVYIPSSFSDSIRKGIKSYGSEYEDIKEARQITNGIYSTGEMGISIKEQSLIIHTNKGLVIVTGCAHPGVLNVIKKSKELLNKEVYLVLGGFHLLGASESELKNIIEEFRKLGVQKVAPSHCSGDKCRKLFQDEYRDHFIEFGVGKIVTII